MVPVNETVSPALVFEQNLEADYPLSTHIWWVKCGSAQCMQ